MRRFALSLIATSGIAILSACSSGGYGLGGNNSASVDGAQLQNDSAQTNQFFLSPAASAPIQINAVGYHGTGATETVVPDAAFAWQAAFAPVGTAYFRGPSPNGNGVCGTPSETPAVTIQRSVPGGYATLATGQLATTVFLGVPTDPVTKAVVAPKTGSTNFCVVVQAVGTDGSVKASAVVVISNAP